MVKNNKVAPKAAAKPAVKPAVKVAAKPAAKPVKKAPAKKAVAAPKVEKKSLLGKVGSWFKR
jgi:hypothetical protein